MVALNINIKNARVLTEKEKVDFKQLLQNEDIQAFIEEKERKAYDKGFSEGRDKGFFFFF